MRASLANKSWGLLSRREYRLVDIPISCKLFLSTSISSSTSQNKLVRPLAQSGLDIQHRSASSRWQVSSPASSPMCSVDLLFSSTRPLRKPHSLRFCRRPILSLSATPIIRVSHSQMPVYTLADLLCSMAPRKRSRQPAVSCSSVLERPAAHLVGDCAY